MNDIAQWYRVLGVTPTASLKTIKEAYRELAQLWHPDRYVDDPELKARAEEEIKEINQAYGEIKAYLASKLNSGGGVESEAISKIKIKQTQQTPQFYYQQGVSFAESQDFDAALTSFAQAVKLNPDYLEAYQYRGFILSKMGFKLRADSEFKKAHQIKLRNRFKKPTVDPVHTDQSSQPAPATTIKTQTSQALQYWQTISLNEGVCNNLIISRGGEIAASNGTKDIPLWQANTGRFLGSLEGHSDRVSCLTLSPSGQTLISGSKDQTIKFWDLRRQKLMRTLEGSFDGHLNEITSLAISPDNQTLLSCDRDNCLKIWDINYGKVIKTVTFTADINSLAINPNGRIFGSGGLEPQIRIRQLKDGQVIRSLNNQSGVLSLAFSPDGRLLATGGFNRTIKLWDITTGEIIYTLTGHTDRISQVIFSRDGQTLISSSWDQTIRLWQLTSGKEIIKLKAHNAAVSNLALTANNQILASSSDRTLKLWHCNF